MSELPPTGRYYEQNSSGFSNAPPSTGSFGGPAGSPPWPTSPSQPSRWPTFAALAIALIATALAIVGWFRPTPAPAAKQSSAAPTYTEQQISDAKARACGAFETAQKGVKLQTNEEPRADPAMRKAQAAAGQLSVVAASWYLKSHVDAATPAPISSAVNNLANLLLDLGANYIAGEHDSDAAQGALRAQTVDAFTQVQDKCR